MVTWETERQKSSVDAASVSLISSQCSMSFCEPFSLSPTITVTLSSILWLSSLSIFTRALSLQAPASAGINEDFTITWTKNSKNDPDSFVIRWGGGENGEPIPDGATYVQPELPQGQHSDAGSISISVNSTGYDLSSLSSRSSCINDESQACC